MEKADEAKNTRKHRRWWPFRTQNICLCPKNHVYKRTVKEYDKCSPDSDAVWQREGTSFTSLSTHKWVFPNPECWHTQRLTADIFIRGLYSGNASRVELGSIKWVTTFLASPFWFLGYIGETREGWASSPSSQTDALSARLDSVEWLHTKCKFCQTRTNC